MKIRGFFSKAFISFMIFAMVLTGVVPATPFVIVGQNGLNAPVSVIESSDTVYAASAKTITVKKANSTTAKKIHNAIKDGKSIKLKVKGNLSSSKKLVKSLQQKIRKVNKQGVIFKYRQDNSKGKYTYYTITKDNAKAYMYANKFVDKLYKIVKKSTFTFDADVTAALKADMATYPDDDVRRYHLFYELVSRKVERNPRFYYSLYTGEDVPFVYWGVEHNIKTVGNYTIKILELKNDEISYFPDMKNRKKLLKALIKSASVNDTGGIDMELYSFNEFINTSGIKELVLKESLWNTWFIKNGSCSYSSVRSVGPEGYFKIYVPNAIMTVDKTNSFGDLSDAMKIWAIYWSGYFECNFTRPAYGMIYTDRAEWQYGAKAMKTLYKNKAEGVCANFANMEQQLFEQLGITCFYNSSWTLNHAWTVVKVKNSKGKTMWIPYDYGIGPSEDLCVSSQEAKKIMSTEKSRYKEYLSGIKGAPKKKNFKNSDFN